MRAPRFDPMPQGGHDLLLKAALLEGDAARRAWVAWRASLDLDDIDQASYRLVPLLLANLERMGVEDAWIARLRGMRRRMWLENQLLLRRAAFVLRGFEKADLPVLVLKGAALVSQAYGGAHVRPMADIDLLVRWRDFPRALEQMGGAGWTTKCSRARPSGETRAAAAYQRWPEGARSRFGGVAMEQAEPDGPDGAMFDLHWRILSVYQHHTVPFPEALLWDAAEPFEIQGVPARRLAPHHQLLHTCFHGVQAQHLASVRWVADAHHLILSTRERIDWDALVDEVIRHRVMAPVREGLGYLAATYGTPVPADTLRRLAAARLSRVERLERPLRLGATCVRTDYRSAAAKALRTASSDMPSFDRLRILGSLLNRVAIRLPYKHWVRPLLPD